MLYVIFCCFFSFNRDNKTTMGGRSGHRRDIKPGQARLVTARFVLRQLLFFLFGGSPSLQQHWEECVKGMAWRFRWVTAVPICILSEVKGVISLESRWILKRWINRVSSHSGFDKTKRGERERSRRKWSSPSFFLPCGNYRRAVYLGKSCTSPSNQPIKGQLVANPITTIFLSFVSTQIPSWLHPSLISLLNSMSE